MCTKKGLLPKFTRLPLLVMLVFNCAVYILPSRLFVTDVTRYDLTTSLDLMLPLVPFFVVFYVVFSYGQWAGSYIFHCRDSVRLCYRITMANIISKAIFLVFYIFLPTQIVRPEITGSGLFAWAHGWYIPLTTRSICSRPYTAWKAGWRSVAQ